MSDDARSRTPRDRALLVVAVAAAAAAVVLTVAAFRGDPDADEVVLDIEPAVADSPPITVAPLESSAPEASGRPAPPTSMPTPTTAPLSPLADLLGEPGSAVPEVVARRIRPTALVIDDLDLWGPVRAVGLEDDGQLEIPDETEIGWYQYGASPGRPGATVLAAHVTWNRTIGPFYRLGSLEPGARVEVRLEDGSERVYEVVERTIYDKDELPRERIWRNTGDETLVLITCGGDYNPEIRRYRQNIVVYAVPVA